MYKYEKDIKKIKDSGLFDKKWYLQEYPDTKALNMDPIEHYLWIGSLLMRNPSPWFNTAYYLDTYPEVGASGINPLLYYIDMGRAAGHVTSQSKAIGTTELFKKTDKYKNVVRKVDESLPDFDIPIVVVGYNRPKSLSRLLNSLAAAQYHKEVELIISIDDGKNNTDVCDIAEKYEWKHGKKTILVQESHLGLKRHVIQCGDLSRQFDGVVLLEDDLLVSPVFYSFAQQAFDFYRNEPLVSGISLYSHRFNETAFLPFTPIIDGSDVFFMQVPASWGTVWGCDQWRTFKQFYTRFESNEINKDKIVVPGDVLSWPDSSWKNAFFYYLIETDKYIVYPRESLTTNFGDAGVHMKDNRAFQVPLQYSDKFFSFINCDESLAKYDAFCEIIPESLNRVNSNFKNYNYIVDLYGMKPVSALTGEYVLTTKKVNSALSTFGKEMLPLESNVIHQVAGSDIRLVKKDSIEEIAQYERLRSEKLDTENLLYHYNLFDWVLDAANNNGQYGHDKERQTINDEYESVEELKQENELLLLQLHQVQEELEAYYLKYQEMKNREEEKEG